MKSPFEGSMELREYFALAKAHGQTFGDSVLHLLNAFKRQSSVGRVAAVRRVSTPKGESSGDWAVKTANPSLELVPHSIWFYFDGLDDDGWSIWEEDTEKPVTSAAIDWFAGHLTIVDWFVEDDVEFGRLEYLHLCLEIGFAVALARGEILPEPTSSTETSIEPFSDTGRETWIKDRGRSPGGADQAFREFRSHPQYDGTGQAEFRKDCARIWGPSVGRPKSRKRKA